MLCKRCVCAILRKNAKNLFLKDFYRKFEKKQNLGLPEGRPGGPGKQGEGQKEVDILGAAPQEEVFV
jgi:hypothetical protein